MKFRLMDDTVVTELRGLTILRLQEEQDTFTVWAIMEDSRLPSIFEQTILSSFMISTFKFETFILLDQELLLPIKEKKSDHQLCIQ